MKGSRQLSNPAAFPERTWNVQLKVNNMNRLETIYQMFVMLFQFFFLFFSSKIGRQIWNGKLILKLRLKILRKVHSKSYTLRKISSLHCILSSQLPFCRYSIKWPDLIPQRLRCSNGADSVDFPFIWQDVTWVHCLNAANSGDIQSIERKN